MKLARLLPLLFVLVACSNSPAGDPPESLRSKELAQATGGQWQAIDLCAWNGWYGDGICDPFCPLPDIDCHFPHQCAANGAGCHFFEWCDLAGSIPGCGFGNTPGVCKPRPQACVDFYFPVCGCDGVPYVNTCYANASGADVAYYGGCLAPLPPTVPTPLPPTVPTPLPPTVPTPLPPTVPTPLPPVDICTSDWECPAYRRCTAGDEHCWPDPECAPNATCTQVCFGKCVPGAKEGRSCENRCDGLSEDGTCSCAVDCAWDNECCADFAAFCWD